MIHGLDLLKPCSTPGCDRATVIHNEVCFECEMRKQSKAGGELKVVTEEPGEYSTAIRYSEIRDECTGIFLRKNQDYGDSFREDGVLGVMIRLKDKLNRFITLARQEGGAQVRDESLADTLNDMSNYAIMGRIVMEDGKPLEDTRNYGVGGTID